MSQMNAAYFQASGSGAASTTRRGKDLQRDDPFGHQPVTFLKEMPSNNDFNGLLKLR
jgi:hypothetical protein